MDFIMSNEYMRIWFKERKEYEKEVYSSKKGEYIQKRKYLAKNRISVKKEKRLPIIKLKRFRNIPARTEHTRLLPKTDEEAAS